MSYLNYNSTAAPQNHTLNISDIGYDEVLQTRHFLGKFEIAVKKFINAPLHSDVIINSGASECIANCIVWAKFANPYGVICGSALDHSSVKANCDNYDMHYEVFNKKIPTNCSMMFITHVSGKTGEIYDLNKFKRMMSTYAFLSDRDATVEDNLQTTPNARVRQYRPLVVLDATQSIDKLKIDMESMKLDAVFFSLHKIGGPQNYGVMVINSNSHTPFKPLIAGTQQHKLRGGTLNLTPLITAERYLKIKTLNTKLLWEHAVNILKTNNINVIEPTLEHLHNTILIKLDTCPLGIINKLSKDKIYVGAISACSNEEAVTKPIKEGYLRISFTDEKQLSDKILQEIIKAIKDEQAFRLGGGYAEDDLHPDAPEHGDRFEDDVDPDIPSDLLAEDDEEDKNEIGLDFM